MAGLVAIKGLIVRDDINYYCASSHRDETLLLSWEGGDQGSNGRPLCNMVTWPGCCENGLMLIPRHNHLIKISSLIATSYAELQLEHIEFNMQDFESIWKYQRF